MIEILRPSKHMWDYYVKVNSGKGITALSIASAIADRLGGYHISYTATEVLKDLGLLDQNDNPNSEAKEVLAAYLHEKFHRGVWGLEVAEPTAIDDWVLKCDSGNTPSCPEKIMLYVISEEKCSWRPEEAKRFKTEEEAQQFARSIKVAWAFHPERASKGEENG